LTLPRGAREAGLAVLTAGLVLMLASFLNVSGLRLLETESLDLRFRIRGPLPPSPDAVLITVDDNTLATFGRWPLSRRLFAKAVAALDEAGAKVIVLDLLFAEPEQPAPPDLRTAARTAATAFADDKNSPIRSALTRLAEDDPDGELEAALRRSGRVILPVAFSFTGTAETMSPS
jgi:adenylate cyclase